MKSTCDICDGSLVLFYELHDRYYYVCSFCQTIYFRFNSITMVISEYEALLVLPSEVFSFYIQTLKTLTMRDYKYTCLSCGAPALKTKKNYTCLECGFVWEVKEL